MRQDGAGWLRVSKIVKGVFLMDGEGGARGGETRDRRRTIGGLWSNVWRAPRDWRLAARGGEKDFLGLSKIRLRRNRGLEWGTSYSTTLPWAGFAVDRTYQT